LHRKSEHAFERQLTLLEDRCEVGALDKLHRDVLHASAFAEIVNARHVAMCDPARHQQLLLEALLELVGGLGVRDNVRANHLEGDCHAQFLIQAWYTAPIPPEPSSRSMR
jgi:hypothetical protein